jgi:hypothetical protein
MPTDTYPTILAGSISRSWTVDDCFQERDFDVSKPFLPERIAGTATIGCLDDDEKRLLNQIRAHSYCHVFAYVEEYIVPMVLANACRDVFGDEARLRSLLRFAEEEVKHQELLGRACEQIEAGLGVDVAGVPGREAVAEVVLATSPLTALLLTSMIEWFTQHHFVEHIRDTVEPDPLFRDILRFHWIDESRHARLDSLLIDEVASELGPEAREAAVDELLELGTAIDDLLGQQVELDLATLAAVTGRSFTAGELDELRAAQRRSYRWTFLVSGLEHPTFVRIVGEITDDGTAKLAAAAQALSA